MAVDLPPFACACIGVLRFSLSLLSVCSPHGGSSNPAETPSLLYSLVDGGGGGLAAGGGGGELRSEVVLPALLLGSRAARGRVGSDGGGLLHPVPGGHGGGAEGHQDGVRTHGEEEGGGDEIREVEERSEGGLIIIILLLFIYFLLQLNHLLLTQTVTTFTKWRGPTRHCLYWYWFGTGWCAPTPSLKSLESRTRLSLSLVTRGRPTTGGYTNY